MRILDDLYVSGLGGRGGAGFSTAVKVRAAWQNRAELIVNACDGELGAVKDAWVVKHHLDAVIRGAELVAPQRARFAAHRGSDTVHGLQRAGLDVLEVPRRYVSSEETALVSLAHGGLARPMTKRQPFVLGGRDVRGRRIPPTLVLNAETLWRVDQISQYGPDWFRSYGTSAEPGPRLTTVIGHVQHPQVIQTQAGVPLSTLLDAARVLPAETVLLGGLGGAFLPRAVAQQLTWDSASLRPYGAAIGPGLIDVLDPGTCPVTIVTRMLTHAAGESAGQCGACMFGMPAMVREWERLTEAPGPSTWNAVLERLALMTGRGACRFPDGVASLTRSAMQVFSDHILRGCHIHGTCVLNRQEVVPHETV